MSNKQGALSQHILEL